MDIHRLGHDVTVLSDPLPVPGLGFLPVNAFVLHAAETVVVDTGLSLPGRGFMDALGSVVDPCDVRWIWLTHPDRDHTGALFDLLDEAPLARVVARHGLRAHPQHPPSTRGRVHRRVPRHARSGAGS